MSYCRNCGAKLEEEMSYCPRCGTPVAPQRTSQPVGHNDRTIIYLTIAIVLAVVAIAVIIIALFAVGLIPIVHSGPVIGSGNVQTQEISLSDFTAIQASNRQHTHHRTEARRGLHHFNFESRNLYARLNSGAVLRRSHRHRSKLHVNPRLHNRPVRRK
jgi:hypothetical protein